MPHDADRSHDVAKLLYDMLDSCEFLIGFVVAHTLQDLRDDRPFRSAVERELQIIGEALFSLSRVAPDTAGQISEHQRIIRFRHVLVHGYDSIDHDIVWAILQDKLPVLHKELTTLLNRVENGGPAASE